MINQSTQFTLFQHDTHLGAFSIRAIELEKDLELLHQWVTQSHTQYWAMQGLSQTQVYEEYLKTCQKTAVFVGTFAEHPCFLIEVYDPKNDAIAEHYEVQAGDVGMHLLIAQPMHKIAGFTWEVFKTVMHFLFENPCNKRVVVEPDVRNKKIHVLNKKAGFCYQKVINLGHKFADLAWCDRAQFMRAVQQGNHIMLAQDLSPEKAVEHLQLETWQRVNRALICKALSEFAHERLIKPTLTNEEHEWLFFELKTDYVDVLYRFKAKLLELNHWQIDEASIVKQRNDLPAELDAMHFISELRESLGISPAMLPTYLEEVASTLSSSAYKLSQPSLTSAQLTQANFQQVERAMTEGHPCFIANNGRIGFSALDYHNFAPEVGAPIRLVWLAAHEDKIVFSTTSDLDYATLMEQELGHDLIQLFENKLKDRGLNPAQYRFFPVHPWQWFNKLAALFAPDMALHDLVCLGYGADQYQAQQSIRTLFNKSEPNKHYVKLALSILNMGFMRGLSPYYMKATPAINDWIARLVKQDLYFAESGFSILREVAAIGYHNDRLEAATELQSPYRKMLSALWRDNPLIELKANQRLMTMASFLHVDKQGNALLPELIKAADISIEQWMACYLKCYLDPLLHCFYAHNVVFMPHGENVIMVLENNVPVRAIMKDIAEEVALLDKDAVLAQSIDRIRVDMKDDLKILYILTDVFDCFFRFMANILDQQAGYSQQQFWRQVAQSILLYQHTHPELQAKFEQYNLFADEFALSCLNRLQLSNNKQMIDLADPAKNLKLEGMLKNPIASFKTMEIHP
ncbi:GNAT family N-acetyltransferase, partial [Pseudoalteromonas tunicata]|uniref:GNAT family N-acetyltransferase n=1 Tax=Pseudoalteromonas tunicata TaxID=314281 RepID=UPI00273DC581